MENLNHDYLCSKIKNHSNCSVEELCTYLDEYQWYLFNKKEKKPQYRFDDMAVYYFNGDRSWIMCGMYSWDRPIVLEIMLHIYNGITPNHNYINKLSELWLNQFKEQ